MKVRKWKRILAFMVCICMLMGSVQVPVYASEESDVENIFQTEEEKKDAESQTENTVPEIEKDTTETESGSVSEMTGPEQKTEDTDLEHEIENSDLGISFEEEEQITKQNEGGTAQTEIETETMHEIENSQEENENVVENEVQESENEIEILTETESAELEVLETESAFISMYEKIFGQTYSRDITKIIYVAGTAPQESSSNVGTKENPYTNIQTAYENATGNTVLYLEGAYTSGGVTYEGYGNDSSLQGGWLNGNKSILIAADAGISIPMYATWSFGANVGFYRVGISLQYETNTNKEIYCNGYTTVFGGEGMNHIAVTRTGNQYYPTLFGGSQNSVVQNTDLTVNGGTFDRIYGGGSFGSEVVSTANLTVNGLVNGDTNQCSVKIEKDNGLNTLYMDNKGESIVGGGATDITGNFGSVENTNVQIKNLHQNGKTGYYIIPNGGSVKNSNITIQNSKIQNLRRGYGAIYNTISYQVNCSEVSELNLSQLYQGMGLEKNATITVECNESIVSYFQARQGSASGSIEEGKKGITQNFRFSQCMLTTMYLSGNYNGTGKSDTCELNACTFQQNGHIGGQGATEKATLIFRNMGQEIIICNTSTEAKKITQQENPSQVGIVNSMGTHIEFFNTTAESRVDNYYTPQLLLGENAVFRSGSIVADSISGNGKLLLSDGAAATFVTVEEGTSIELDAWGEIKNQCKITAQCKASGAEFYYKNTGLYLKMIPGEQISFWYLSAQELNFDQTKYVYVDQNNKIQNPDGTLGNPYATLEDAYKVLTPERKQIVLMSSYVLPKNTDFPKAEQMGETEIIFSASDGQNDFSDFAKLQVANTSPGEACVFCIQNDTAFTHIKIGGILDNVSAGMIRICANGYSLRMGEGSTTDITSGNVRHTSIYGSVQGKSYDKIKILIEDGAWSTIGSGEGTIGTALKEGELNSTIITDIHLKGGKYSSLTLGGITNGSVQLTVENATSNGAWNQFGGIVNGDTKIEFKGNIEGNSYGDPIYGDYRGKFTFDTTQAEKYVYYYSLTLAGTFHQGAEILVGKNCKSGSAGGLNLAGVSSGKQLTAYEPVNVRMEEGASFYSVYAADISKAKFFENGCINLYAAVNTNLTMASSIGDSLTYKDQIYDNCHLYLTKSENPIAVENLYGFETITLEEDSNVVVTSPLHTKKLELKNNAKLSVIDKVTIGIQESENGILQILQGSYMELLQPLCVYGIVKGTMVGTNPGRLALNNELFPEEEKEQYSKITGNVEGNIELFTNQKWSDRESQRLYVNSENEANDFSYPSEEINSNVFQDREKWVCSFGNKKDYSVIYLDGTNGKNDNDGLTPQMAVQTLDQAYSLVTSGGTILICGKTTVTEWPVNAKKKVTITSCHYSGKDKVDYRKSNGAQLILPAMITLKADTEFACLELSCSINALAVNAGGYAVTFGVKKEELPEGIENFSNTKIISSVWGTNSSYRCPTSITIHSGNFGNVDPWTNDQRNEKGESEKTVYSVTMTGGTVNRLGLGTYTCPKGIGEYHLSGGKVGILGANTLTSYASKNYIEIYNISDAFSCDAFYVSTSSVNTKSVKINVKDLTQPFPLLCYGNSSSGIIAGSVNVTVENAIIQNMQGGTSNSKLPDASGDVSIRLKKGAIVENLHCGSSGEAENLKHISIYLEDSTAQIKNLYANGISGKLRPEKIELYAVNGESELPIDFLREPIDLLQIGQGENKGCASIDKESAKYIKKLSVESQNTVLIGNGTVFGGDYQGGNPAESPAIWKTDNAASIEFSGNVSGYTEVTTGATNGFKNGFKIKAKACTTNSAETAFTTKLTQNDERTIVYEKTETDVVWSLEDSEDNETRNTIYVSSKGDDSYAGAQGTPVKTLAKAYKLVAERKKAIEENNSLTEEDKKKLIDELSICVLDYAEVGEKTQEEQLEIPEVTIKGENPTKNPGIVFTDMYPTYKLETDTVLENITFYDQTGSKSPEIYAQGYELTVESSVSMDQKSRANKSVTLYGGSQTKEVTSTNLTILGGSWKNIFGGGKETSVNGDVNLVVGDKVSVDTVYGGGALSKATVNGNVTLTVSGGIYQNLYGGGESAQVTGNVKVDYQYGTIKAFYGGGMNGGASVKNIDIQLGTYGKIGEEAKVTNLFRGSGLRAEVIDKVSVSINENAHILEGVQFCAGGYAGNVKATEVLINGGMIETSIYGGGWGETNTNVYGNIQNTTNVIVNAGTINGNVYAGGNNGTVGETASLTIKNGTVIGNLYGGGDAAGVKSSQVNVEMADGVIYTGNIFGGSYNITEQEKDIQKVSAISVISANLDGNIFAGSDTAGNISETAQITVNGTAQLTGGIFGGGCQAPMLITPDVIVLQDAILTGNVYGGGQGVLKEQDGVLTSIKNGFRSIGNFLLDIVGSEKEFSMNGLQDANVPKTNVVISGKVNGNVYGGGELATTGTKIQTQQDVANGTERTETSVTNVVINSGAVISGDIYGGGKGQADQNFATVFGNTKVDSHGIVQTKHIDQQAENMTGGNIFGGGEAAMVEGTATVMITEGSVTNVYGGGNQASAISSDLTIAGGKVTTAYSGGNQAEVADANITITGGTIETAYAGGNSATVTDKAELILNTGKDQKCVGTIFSGNNQAAMSIQPVMKLVSGQCDTFYGGGNQGDMTIAGGLKYGAETFGSSDVSIGTVYGGCNNADVTNGVELTFTQGNYTTVYGGNNAGGEAHTATVILDEGITKQLNVAEVYGGGNQANIQKTQVKVVNGTFPSVYGGGNQATVTKQAVIQLGENDSANTEKNPSVTHLFGGNNNADMAIQPEFSLLKGKAENVYGGCNKGKMTKEQLSFTFTGEAEITNLYGGCNEADVTGKLQMILKNLPVENAYGGCNTMGHIQETEVVVQGTGAKNIFGGGRGNQTSVDKSHVKVQNGTVAGNVYGGSGYGYVKDASVTVKEETDSLFSTEKPKIVIEGNVFGGGYGVDSVVENTHVTVDMNLSIGSGNNVDLMVTEAKADTTDSTADGGKDASSGETQTKVELKNTDISTIEGSVYGGGDMGKVGDGMIHQATNTATIETPGTTDVQILGGNIVGSVFGGGSGTPAAGESYTIYMGTVFGKCNTTVQGGYIKGSIYGCGHQSRVYASDTEGKKQAAEVKIQEVNDKSVVIGTSIFGGGNKGEGANQNASVYTVVGDTSVIIDGLDNKSNSTAIYFLSDSKGGVYGDGNLCLVKGNRMIQISDFNYGANNHELLKTFYSLQRADQVTLTRTKIVLRGAKDLVDENADETVYAINRVGNLELKESSTVKLTTIVKLLGGLSSDQNTDTVYIDRGHNGENSYINRGGTDPTEKLTKDSITQYRTAYADYIENKSSGNAEYKSFNVICVANGDYLEVKKSDSEYGNVTGLFTLELLHANPGEGGGFVFANIGDPKTSGTESGTENAGSTGDFICVTKNSADGNDYMEIMDTVGGYSGTDYTYYYWYIKGGKYTYNTNLQGYIGTSDTTFEAGARMPELRKNYHYILNKITGSELTDSSNSTNQFAKERWQDSWNETQMQDMDAYAIEVQMVPRGKGTQESKSLGYLAYGTEGASDGKTKGWYIKQDNNASLAGTGDSNQTNQETLKKNDVFEVTEGMTGLELKFILHKGSSVTVEIKNVPIILEFDVLGETTNGEYQTGNGGENAHVKIQTYTSITRIVPSQAIYMSGGRMYAGVSSDMQPSITGNSAFTAQVITKYVPSAFNSTGSKVKEVLTASYDEIYLIDEQRGIGFTVRETENGIDLIYATEGNKEDYEITKDVGGAYKVTYKEKNETGASGQTSNELKTISANQGSFIFPKGTKITLVAQMDDFTPTYWYYYVTEENKKDISLQDFKKMNTVSSTNNQYSFENASEGKITCSSSNRVTENLTFVFDFSEVEKSVATEAEKVLSGSILLRHQATIGSYTNVDIMDFVSKSTTTGTDGNPVVQYSRETPKISEPFKVSQDETGIKEFTIQPTSQEYYEKDTYEFQIDIQEDETWMNTQYEEREYAVVLELVETTGNGSTEQVKKFPEGTTFWYQGNRISAGQENSSVIIPVKEEGKHLVTVQTELQGFTTGENKIRASLYSSSVASYYNSISTSQKAEAVFHVIKTPEIALSVSGSGNTENTLLQPGESIQLAVSSTGQIKSQQKVIVTVYQYQKSTKNYRKMQLDQIFETPTAELEFGDAIWKTRIKEQAEPGTYRLEFQYGDKTEYWDFIIS